MKKRKIAKMTGLLLAAVLLTGCFAGCSGGGDQNELIIGITYFAPMNYMEDGELTGFETEFATAVCEKLGMTPKFQEIKWESKETELNGNAIDCIWNGMTIDDDRKESMQISVPYMRNKQVAVVLKENAEKYKDLTNLEGVTVVAEAKSAGETVATTDETFQDASYTPVDAQSKALLEVKSKTAEICLVDYVLTIGSIGEGTDYEDLVVLEKDFAPEEYGIAFKKGNTELCDKVNQAIQELADEGKLYEIAAKYKLEDLLLIQPSK
ncbi:MAG TPA: transporter substrate-binding domain-containing protein [Candidatus Egerieisoma faecipullorum]|uniref:Transporter substrate-binding domain-containing protein n=1 Tax=Candidatus Egerieisoma faecipullorum TaxID=2840963 RepID=A0A9D1I5Q9_9CLOT|nr:transporter substrate-binding domain-containing protein [Candidatus Egerieisoma faecipullorum]